MKLRLLIDTCVWLDLTKDPRHLPVLDALFAMTEADEIQLILPQIIRASSHVIAIGSWLPAARACRANSSE